jgi:hypothetical protein
MTKLLLSTSALAIAFLHGCAEGTELDSPGPEPQPPLGGSGGAGGDGGATGGEEPVPCGNGRIDPGEDCDGDDLQGVACGDLGLGPGELACTATCTLDAGDCALIESLCANGLDDDDDDLIDCDDVDCVADPKCSDACALPFAQLALGFQIVSTTDGRPDLLASSCEPGAAPEVVLELLAVETTTYYVQAYAPGADVSLSVRSSCADAASEIACADHEAAFYETVSFAATAGATYFIVVEHDQGDTPAGAFAVDVTDSFTDPCWSEWDEDLDGLPGTSDPDCAATLGNLPLGAACNNEVECDATLGDPLCLHGVFATKFCSEFCDPVTDPCPGGAACVENASRAAWLCLPPCATTADCPNGLTCADVAGTLACTFPPEDCDDRWFQLFNETLLDCVDPACTGTPSCIPGTGGVGAVCEGHTDCASHAGGDPYCADDDRCTEFCRPNDCAAGDVCIDLQWGKSFHLHGTCHTLCETDADCDLGGTQPGSCKAALGSLAEFQGVLPPKTCHYSD